MVTGEASDGQGIVQAPLYDAYNAVKHDQGDEFPRANLAHALNALAAVQILFSAQFGMDPEAELKQGFDAPDFYTAAPDYPPETVYVPPPPGKGETQPKKWTPVLFKF